MPHSVQVAFALARPMGSSSSGSARRAFVLRAVIELAIAAAVFAVYRAGRLVTNDSVADATANADRVVDVQRWLGGAVELTVQRWMLDVPGAIELLNHFYVFVHFPATTLFLVWTFVRRRDRYSAIRNWFVGVMMVAMVVHVVFPLAPPRMLDGYVDTLREYGPNIYPEDPSRSVANQFAAMPSLHFGWALMVAFGIILVTSGRHRWWWLAHPAVTLVAIVATGNHYLLDAAVAGAIALAVGWLVLPPRRKPTSPTVPAPARPPATSRAIGPSSTRRHRCSPELAAPHVRARCRAAVEDPTSPEPDPGLQRVHLGSPQVAFDSDRIGQGSVEAARTSVAES